MFFLQSICGPGELWYIKFLARFWGAIKEQVFFWRDVPQQTQIILNIPALLLGFLYFKFRPKKFRILSTWKKNEIETTTLKYF